MSSKFLCISFVFFFGYGMAQDCNYRFIGLNDTVTLSSSTEMYELAHTIFLHDVNRDIPAQGIAFFLNETSQYFFLEGNYLLVIACLPAGLHEVLTFIIERDERCAPGYLVIDVTPTVPVFDHIPSKVTVDVDTCSVEDRIEVYNLRFEKKEDCNVFNCTVVCVNCPGGKRFWTKNETVIVASSKNIRFGHPHNLRIICVDGSLAGQQFDNSQVTAFAELTVEFEKLNTVTCSVPVVTSPSTTEGSASTETSPAETHSSTTVLTTAKLSVSSLKTTTMALTSLSTKKSQLNKSTTTMQNANQEKQITTSPPRPMKTTMNDAIASTHATKELSQSMTTTETQGMTTASQTSADPSKLVFKTLRNDRLPPKTTALTTPKVTTMHKAGTSVLTTTTLSNSVTTTIQTTTPSTKETTMKTSVTTQQTTKQSTMYTTMTAHKTMKALQTTNEPLTSKSTTMNNAMASHSAKESSKSMTTLSGWSTAPVSTPTPSSISATGISPTAVSVTAPPTSVSSSTSTSGSPTANNNGNGGFFNKTENIAAVSAAGGVVLLCAIISIIYAVWSKCCQEGLSSSGGNRKKGNRVSNSI